jgi:hypothetical protein
MYSVWCFENSFMLLVLCVVTPCYFTSQTVFFFGLLWCQRSLLRIRLSLTQVLYHLFTCERRQIERNKLAREKQLREAAEREKAAMEQRLMQYQEEIRLANEALVMCLLFTVEKSVILINRRHSYLLQLGGC